MNEWIGTQLHLQAIHKPLHSSYNLHISGPLGVLLRTWIGNVHTHKNWIFYIKLLDGSTIHNLSQNMSWDT